MLAPGGARRHDTGPCMRTRSAIRHHSRVGDFTTLLLDINPTYTTTGYPNAWTQFTVTISGVGSPTPGRLAFRYFVENGGPNGANSDYIGIDTVQYSFACQPTPTPAPTA